MSNFADSLIEQGVTDFEEIALEWIEANPTQYHPKTFPGIQRTFRKIVTRKLGKD